MENKKYTAFSIPPGDANAWHNKPLPINGGNLRALQPPVTSSDLMSEAFAEVELGFISQHDRDAEKAIRLFSSAALPETIERKAIDPVRQRFFDMRSLASDRPFARNDSELFRKQAKFMECFEDDYPGEANLNMYYPYYQHMGYEQLRTYFTWRTKMRLGEMRPISASYAFIYAYELLSNIGVGNPSEGLSKLTALLTEYASGIPVLANHLLKWIKDYHIYYELPHSFEDYVKKHNLYSHYPAMFLFDPNAENKLELWSRVSSYPIAESKFCADGNKDLLSECFNAVLDAMDSYHAKRKTRIEDFIIYRISNRTPWDPFNHALFHPWLNQPDRQLKLPGHETYYCRNNRWTSSLPMFFSNLKYIAEYLIKKTESCLRETVNYKYKLKISASLQTQLRGKNLTLDPIIQDAVANFHKQKTRTVVTVSLTNLSRIREEAQGTLDKLTVREDEAEFKLISSDSETNDTATQANLHPSDPQPANTDSRFEMRGSPENECSALKEALTPLELQALTIIISDSASIKAFAAENSIMLEILADGINEKAADTIGDSILEVDLDCINIYDDYMHLIKEIINDHTST